VRALRWICGVKPKPKAGNKPLHHFILHGLDKPGSSATVSIFVANIAFTTTEEELERLFEPYGIVNRVQIVTDRDTGRSRGFGFVEMPDATEAQAAIDGLNGTSLEDRTLTVNEARPREGDNRPRRPRDERRPRW
jgi:cold-inducible RNA-binding protein